MPPPIPPATALAPLTGSAIVLGPLQIDRDKIVAASEVIDASTLNAPPPIDERVVGGGDAVLWTRDEDKKEKDRSDAPN